MALEPFWLPFSQSENLLQSGYRHSLVFRLFVPAEEILFPKTEIIVVA